MTVTDKEKSDALNFFFSSLIAVEDTEKCICVCGYLCERVSVWACALNGPVKQHRIYRNTFIIIIIVIIIIIKAFLLTVNIVSNVKVMETKIQDKLVTLNLY